MHHQHKVSTMDQVAREYRNSLRGKKIVQPTTLGTGNTKFPRSAE
jgi:hypothetical protein